MSELGRQVTRSIGWSGLTALVMTAVQLLQTVVLARLLGPEIFGLMAMVTVTFMFAGIIGQMGLHESIVSRKDVTPAELSSLYWFGIFCGVVTYLVFLLLTPLIALAFGEQELGALLPVALAGLVIAPIGAQFAVLAQKSLRFGFLAWVNIGSALLVLIVTVASAWIWDQGVWSLIWGHLSGVIANSGVFAVYGWFVGPRPKFRFAAADLRGYLSFGFYRIAAMGINFLVSRADQILIGSLLGTQALGYYSLATNIVLTPIQKINPVITRVAFPVFAKLQDDIALLKRSYLHLLRALAFINAPILLGMAAVAPIALPFLLGEQWEKSVLLIQILAIYALVRSVGNASGSLILGLGRADITFLWNLGLLFVFPPVLYVASRTGSMANIAWSMVALQVILYMALYVIIVRRLLGPCFASFVGAFAVPAGLAAAMGAAVIGLAPFLNGFPAAIHLSGLILAGVTCYALLAVIFQSRYLKQVFRIVKGEPWNM